MNEKRGYPKLFHIGIPKTGTSTIQHNLRNDNRINLIQKKYFNTYEWWTKCYDYYNDNLINIVSDENLILQVNYGKLILTLSRIQYIVPDAQIILSIREQRELLKSRYKSTISYHTGVYKSFEEWLKSSQGMDYLSVCMYDTVYRTISTFFPANQIHLLLFEDLKYNYCQFFKKLYSIIGIEMPKHCEQNVIKNKSLTEFELLIIKRMNRFKIFRNDNKLAINEAKLVRKYAALFKDPQKTVNCFQWSENKLFNNIEKDIRRENQQLIRKNMLDRDKLVSYDYLI